VHIKFYGVFDTCDGHVYCNYTGRQQGKKYLPVNTQGAAYYSGLGESECDSQISLSSTNAKQEIIKRKKK